MTMAETRLPALDNFRALLALLGIPFHTVLFLSLGSNFLTILHNPNISQLTYHLGRSATALVIAVFYLHAFWMPAFFLLAGFVARLLCQQKSLNYFVVNRIKKIAVPFLFLLLWTLPFYGLYLVLRHYYPEAFSSGLFSQVTLFYSGTHGWTIPDNLHDLWFLYYLLMFDVLTIVAFYLTCRSNRLRRLFQAMDKLLVSLFRRKWAPVLLALCLTVILSSQSYCGYRPFDGRLDPSLRLVAFYGCWYFLGWWLWAHTRQFSDFFKATGLKIFLSVVLYGSFIYSYYHLTLKTSLLEKSLPLFSYQLSLSLMVLASFCLAWRYLARHNALLRYLSGASYWLYLIQVPIILALVALNSAGNEHFFQHCGFIILATFAIGLSSYQLLVRHTWLNHFIGQRH